MEITYSYKINELKVVKSESDATQTVTEVKYRYIGTSAEGVSSEYPGYTELPAPSSVGFIPLAELTEEAVVAWLIEHAYKETMNYVIEGQIKLKSGIIYSGSELPWYVQEEMAPISTMEPSTTESTPE
jgi:hypothetical protein